MIDERLEDCDTILEVKNSNGQYGVGVMNEPKDIFEFGEEVLKPLLRTMGYADKSIAELFNEDYGFEITTYPADSHGESTTWDLKNIVTPIEVGYTEGDRFIARYTNESIFTYKDEIFTLEVIPHDEDDTITYMVAKSSMDGDNFGEVEVKDPYNITSTELDNLLGNVKGMFTQIGQ